MTKEAALGLTDRQRQVLAFLSDHIRRIGYPPTRAEVARHFGFNSANAAEDHLKALDTKRYIRLTPGVARGIVVLPQETRSQA